MVLILCPEEGPMGHSLGDKWTFETLKKHREAIVLSETVKSEELRGIRPGSVPIFDAIDVDHYIPPILHIQLGAINTLHESVILEVQSVAEIYTKNYKLCQEQALWLKNDIKTLASAKKKFEESNKERVKALGVKVRKKTETEEERTFLTFYNSYLNYFTHHLEQSKKKLQQELSAWDILQNAKKSLNNLDNP